MRVLSLSCAVAQWGSVRKFSCAAAAVLLAMSFAGSSVAVGEILEASGTSGFTLTVNTSGLTDKQNALVDTVEAYWNSVIVGYKSSGTLTGVTVYLSSGTLSAGTLASTSSPYICKQGNYWYTDGAYGPVTTKFNSLYANTLSDSAFTAILKHEVAHAIGFGATWAYNRTGNSLAYTGAAAVAAYNAEFGLEETSIPLEQGGSSGTRGVHWDETDYVQNTPRDTGIISLVTGLDFMYELMTGWMDDNYFDEPCSIYVSNATIQSFADNGYIVVPEPGSLVLLVVGALGSLFFIATARRVHTTSRSLENCQVAAR